MNVMKGINDYIIPRYIPDLSAYFVRATVRFLEIYIGGFLR